MPKVFQVAWREFKQTVMRPVFLLAVIGMPVLILGIMAIAVLIMIKHEEPALVGTVAVVDETGEVGEAAKVEFDTEQMARERERQRREAIENAREAATSGMPPGAGQNPMDQLAQRGAVVVEVEPHTAAPDQVIALRDQLQERIRAGELLGAAFIMPAVLATPDLDAPSNERPKFELLVGEDVDSDHVDVIERSIGQSIVRVRAQRAGHRPEDVMAMLRTPRADTSRTLKAGGVAAASQGMRELAQMVPMVFMMLIWIGVFSSAQHLMMSTIEEKSNRVMEVLLSAVSPMQLMTGKIFGHGAVGLLIVGIYSSVGIAALIIFAAMHYINPMDLVYLAVFYFMAYFMIASMMASVGSAVSDIREANTLVTPVMIIVMIPLMLWMPIIKDPNGPIAVVFSFIPPAIPFAMILRLAAEETVPTWQIVGSIVWGYACVLGMIWMAAKIFRVGVLMYGKPPNPIELIKWLRYS